MPRRTVADSGHSASTPESDGQPRHYPYILRHHGVESAPSISSTPGAPRSHPTAASCALTGVSRPHPRPCANPLLCKTTSLADSAAIVEKPHPRGGPRAPLLPDSPCSAHLPPPRLALVPPATAPDRNSVAGPLRAGHGSRWQRGGCEHSGPKPTRNSACSPTPSQECVPSYVSARPFAPPALRSSGAVTQKILFGLTTPSPLGVTRW